MRPTPRGLVARAAWAALAAAATLALAGCPGRPDRHGDAAGEGGAEDAACVPPEHERTAVISRFGFVRQDPMMPGVVDGFDLDDHVSRAGDPRSCRHEDLVSPDGTPGINNQLAQLLPIVDSMTGGVIDSAIQTAINNGQLLITLSVEDLDDLCHDDQVTLVFQRVSGMPFIGADMMLDPGQTFDLQRDDPVTRVPARVTDGVLEAGPFTLPLPIAVLDASFTLNLYSTRVRARLTDDGGMDGLIGGGIARDEFLEHVHTFNIPMSLMTAVESALTLFADLDRNASGQCAQVSAALRFSARSAFVNP